MRRAASLTLAILVLACVPLIATASPGVILLTSTHYGVVEVPPHTVLQGIGQARVIGSVILNEGSAVDGIEITGWRDATWNFSAGVLVRGSFARVRDCYIHHGPSHGVQVIGGHTGVQIVGNRIHHVGTWRMSGSEKYPLAAWRGISIESGNSGAFISGNEIVDAWESGIFEHGSPGTIIRDNVIVRPNRGRVDSFNAGSGNGIESLSDAVVIEGNSVLGALTEGSHRGRSGIVVGGDGSIVSSNSISRLTGTGILALGDADGRVISHNAILDVGAWSTNEAGIRLFSYSGNTSALSTLILENSVSRVRGGVGIRTGNRDRAHFTLVAGNTLNGLRILLEGTNERAFGNI